MFAHSWSSKAGGRPRPVVVRGRGGRLKPGVSTEAGKGRPRPEGDQGRGSTEAGDRPRPEVDRGGGSLALYFGINLA